MNAPAQTNPQPRTRPLVGGVSVLLLVAFAVAGPSGGLQPLLATLAGQVSVEGGTLRAWSGTIATVVRNAARRSSTHAMVRPAPAIAARDLLRTPVDAPAPEFASRTPGPGGTVRIELLNLPPPLL